MAAKKKEPVKEVKQSGRIGTSIDNTVSFLQASWKDYGMYMLKVELISFATGLAFLVLIIGLLALMLGAAIFSGSTGIKNALASVGIAGMVIAGIIVLALAVAYMMVENALKATLYAATDMAARQKKLPPIIETAKELFWPATKYMVTMFGIIIAIFVLPALGIIFSGELVGILLMIPAMIVLLAVAFLTQFSFYELIINKKSIIECFKASIELVKKNVLSTIAFDIILTIIVFAIAIAFWIVSLITQMPATALIAISPIVGLGASMVLSVIIGIVQGVAITMIIMPFMYNYWKRLQG